MDFPETIAHARQHQHQLDESFWQSRFLLKFKPIEILGQGGYGIVFRAQEMLDNNREVAVKRISLPTSDEDLKYALKEVDALFSFRHPGIVRFLDGWTEEHKDGWQKFMDDELKKKLNYTKEIKYFGDGRAFVYIKMDLCKSTLAEWLAENEQRDLKQIKSWFKQIVEAVAYIHRRRRIHRDLKPSNILFNAAGRIQICDLGIISDYELATDEKDERSQRSYTSQIGTDRYMAPEQASFFGMYTNKADIFALGLILAEMCVYMSDDVIKKVFDNIRSGEPNDCFQNLKDIEDFVFLLTNSNDIDRPDCEQILSHNFLDGIKNDVEENDPTEPGLRRFNEYRTKFEERRFIGAGSNDKIVYEALNVAENVSYAIRKQRIPAKIAESFVSVSPFPKHEGIVNHFACWTEMPRLQWLDLKRRMPNLYNNPNVVSVLTADQMPHYQESHWFLYRQMELCKGTLAKWLCENTTRDLCQAKKWFKQIVSAAAYLHSKGIMHKGLKTSKIYFSMDDYLKIGGIPIQLIRSMTRDEYAEELINSTSPGEEDPAVDEAPERWRADDVFALGIVMAQLCTVMTEEEVDKFFRCGMPDGFLDHLPEVKEFVTWMTKINYTMRPTCEEILQHPFIATPELD